MSLQEQLTLILQQFHWLRPWWLVALLPLAITILLLWKSKRQALQWQQVIAPELLPYLLDGKTTAPKKSLLWILLLSWLIAVIALAGPSWIKRPTPVEKNQNALVILLDLSQSMLSEDLKPSRLVRARLKITDILRERKDGQTALVVYAGESHTVTPLSDDSATLNNLLPSLSPNIMPLPGSNTEDAVAQGIKLLRDAGTPDGDLLLITDGVVPEAFPRIHELLANTQIRLSVLGVGSQQPVPIPTGNGGFARDRGGSIITTQLNSNELANLAQNNRGRYRELGNSNNDIKYLLPTEEKDTNKTKPAQERDFDQWFDQGHWLVFLLLPVVLVCFRRGFMLALFIMAPLFLATPNKAYALEWNDLWLTQDQKAARKLNEGDAKSAAELFKSPDWKAAAQYRAGDYAAAAESYAKSDSAQAHYNRGNALAKGGKLEESLKAYDEALKRDPSLEDAQKNRALVEQLLKQQQDQKKDSDKNQKSGDKNKQDQDKKDQDQKNQQDQKSQQDQNNQQDQNSQDKKDQQKGQQSSQSQSDGKQQGEQNQQNGGASSSADSRQQSDQHSSVASKQGQQQGQQGSASSAAATSAQAAAQQSSRANGDKNAQAQVQPGDSDLTPEEKQALEKWLRLVPDDPGGLLRKKFEWQYREKLQQKMDGQFERPQNNADQRW